MTCLEALGNTNNKPNQRTSLKIKLWTWHLQNMKQKCHPLDCYVQ